MADSQLLRWIDELNGIVNADERAKALKSDIRRIRKEHNKPQNKKLIRQLYAELDELQFKEDYMCLIIDKEKDYYRACRGFSINGVKYRRLLGTNGGIKNSTIVFVSDRLADELIRRIENGRDPNKELVTAKLEAYKALTCSASIPVSTPNGILVVNDAETEFVSDIIYLTDEGDGEPFMEERKNEAITLDATDGCGIMLPSLAERWSKELGLDYIVSGVNTRFSFEKGMVFTFDFLDFAEKVAGSYIVKDAWGDEVDIRNVELVMTTSMVKLWDSYSSCADYVQKSLANGYTFGIAKTCPETLESERSLNYQFIQSYDLDDDEIDELINPTIDEIQCALGDDWRKTIVYLRGSGLTEENIDRIQNDYIKAIMIDQSLLDDPYVQNSIFQMIRKKINSAKVGVIKVHGNYSIVSGDPYLLCQSMFGLEKTGLLKAGEIYNQYWADAGADKLACFRAPMTCHNNIRLVHPVDTDQVRYWYQYIKTATVFNGWDTAFAALNGMDCDGDIVMLTDNHVLVDNLRPLPALMCAQRKAAKRVSTEEDFIHSNIDSFGSDIGQTTNWITSMFEVRSHFPAGSDEYEALSYRIRCGQLYQQNSIDRSKGVVCKPMPKEWHERRAASKLHGESTRSLYRKIVADKKPYFMRYIYPALMKQYNTYIKNTNRNALREFEYSVDDLLNIPADELTERQEEFITNYKRFMPVGIGHCLMNKICRKIEAAFDHYVGKRNKHSSFDYRIMKSGAEYTPRECRAIKRLLEDYNKRVSNYLQYMDYERIDETDSYAAISQMDDEFMKECSIVCPDQAALCDIILDLCYSRNSTKRFAWNMCGDQIIENLLQRNGGIISFPVVSTDNPDFEYCGKTYAVKTKQIGGVS